MVFFPYSASVLSV